ncbi:hypothetical protein AB0H18_17145 [Streptomyces sp. NPDC020766]|uniref:hypothetical protein n=1 Tax=Streptomyces sp. NPDC020766 TaxID=3155011 RepID=UPI0033D18F98
MDLPAEELCRLPGVRRQLGRLAADLEAGLTCVWLLPDDMVTTGYAEDLHLTALHQSPERLNLPRPPTDTGGRVAGAAFEAVGSHIDDLPVLDDYDDGFDIGWEPTPSRSRTDVVTTELAPSDLVARLAKELSVAPGEVTETLVRPSARWYPVIGIQAWTEPEPPWRSGERASERGQDIARLIRVLGAAVKEAGLPPDARPRLLVTARVQDLPALLPDELELDLAVTAVHWWWGVIGRLDTATVVSARGDHGGHSSRRGGEALRSRILRAVREEVVSEVCGPNLGLAVSLAGSWDGSDRTLDDCLRACLADGPVPPTATGSAGHGVSGTEHRPGANLRTAWALGTVQSWEGRPRHHPAGWYSDGRTARPDALTVLVSQAQQRVLLPWIEEARRRLAILALPCATRPVIDLVSRYIERPPTDFRTHPRRAFEGIEVGPMLKAHRDGQLSLPANEARLLEVLVTARNVLSHRGVLYDATLNTLCAELARADRRWAQAE